MRVVIGGALGALVIVAMWLSLDTGRFTVWIVDQQRAFQNQMAEAVLALKSGQVGAYAALFLATGFYGFVHALGPGHGKYLVGGVGLGTTVARGRLLGIAALSSLAQSLFAILLVYGAFSIITATADRVTALAEDVLTPLSFLAIGCVGLVLIWRGLRGFGRQDHQDHDGPHCGHSHGPTAAQVREISSLREALFLIASIAVRPCTGAIFLLVIAWQMDLKWAGAAAVIVMGLGTAALTGLVALTSVAARDLVLSSWVLENRVLASVFQVLAGVLIVAISLSLLAVI